MEPSQRKLPQYHRVVQQKVIDGLRYFLLKYNSELMKQGACSGLNTEMFYPEVVQYTKIETKFYDNLCKDCPIKMACLEWGLAHERYGVWGGTTPDTRTTIRRKLGWAITDPNNYSDSLVRS